MSDSRGVHGWCNGRYGHRVTNIRAVLFDMGGVLTTSPFDNFAALERRRGWPENLIIKINSLNPDTNAWAQFERGELDQPGFVEVFDAEARAMGHEIDGHDVLACLNVEVRPAMVSALKVCAANFKTALLTNNFKAIVDSDEVDGFATAVAELHDIFDFVVESAKTGVRKPDPRFYEMAYEALGVDPTECIFLDDLGMNLKPARAMGMTTIKVTSEAQALVDLAAATGLTWG